VAHGRNGRNIDPGIKLVLGEIRDLRREMREDRRQAEAAAAADRRQAEVDRRQAEADRRRSDERFEQLLREFREDSARHAATTEKAFEATQRAFRDIRTVGLSIVKTLNRHTRLLERIDRKLGVRGNGRPGNGRTA
jgi:phage shock protein A